MSAWKFRGRGRVAPRKCGEMNKTEEKHAWDLEVRRRAGEIAWYKYEGITFKLADDTRYTPDFAVMLANGEIEFHEVKGRFFRDDAKVKLSVASAMYPFRFLLIQGGLEKEL